MAGLIAKHTPGPWAHCENVAGNIIGSDGVVICSVYGSEARAEEDDANQALIAAAPDLLAALDRAEAFIAGFEDDDTQEGIPEMLAAIRAAIAKAKGEV